MSTPIRIATRGSRLALVQARLAGDALQKHTGRPYALVTVKTTGDKFMGDLSTVGGKGVFVKEIEEALLAGEADIAVHSMKDMPGADEQPKGLTVAAMLPREDIRDVCVCREGESFVALKPGAKIGTSSLRRATQLRNTFPYLEVVPIRGNVDSRLDKLKNREVDALILAKAGLDRLGLTHRISEVFEPDMMCPAVGQGAIGVQCREDDADMLQALAAINDADTFTCVNAERAMLHVLGGNCHTPIAGFCQVTKGGSLRLIALVASLDGKQVVRTRQKMPYADPQAIGRAAGDDLIAQGADRIIAAITEGAVA
jgi:hydroxymethylbilane synthase